MSILSMLLNPSQETTRSIIKSLPKGNRRTHKINDIDPVKTNKKKKPTDKQKKKKTTSSENCEIVYSAIVSGARTVKDMQQATVFCKTTIWRALTQLETWPTGQRIKRNDDNKPARFEIFSS